MKVSKGLDLLSKIRHYVCPDTTRSLYFSFVNAHTDYNLLNWGMASSSSLNPVHTKINKALRIMTFNNRDSPSIPLYKELKILPLEKSYELKNAKHLWKLHNGYLPQSLASNFNVNSRNQITKSYSRLESLKRFSLFTAPSIWNKLPNSIKDKTTLKSFSDSVKLHLLNELSNAPYF